MNQTEEREERDRSVQLEWDDARGEMCGERKKPKGNASKAESILWRIPPISFYKLPCLRHRIGGRVRTVARL